MIWMGFSDTPRPDRPDSPLPPPAEDDSKFVDEGVSASDASEALEPEEGDESDADQDVFADEPEDDGQAFDDQGAGDQEPGFEDQDELTDQTVVGEIGDTVNSLVPWAISLLAHAALILIAIFIVWSVRTAVDEQEVIIPLVNLSETPGVPLQVQVQERVETTSASQSPSPSVSDSSTPMDAEISVDVALPGLGEPVGAAPSFGLELGDAAAFDTNFLGSGGNARNIVFVIDASGSLVDIFPAVIKELKKTIRKLSEKQRFAIVFIQADRVVEVPPGRLVAAKADAKGRAIQWIDPASRNITTLGSGDAVAAITRALKMKPDLVYLLSDNITGKGRYALDQRQLLDDIDRANRGGTKINTIQFVYPDPLEDINGKGTLQLIAERTGGIYTFVPEAR